MVLELCFGNIFPLLYGYKSYPVFSQHFYSLLFIVACVQIQDLGAGSSGLNRIISFHLFLDWSNENDDTSSVRVA